MKTSKITITAIMIAMVSLFTECKKGEGDPFISLRSRKARVTGDWSVTKYNETMTSVNSSGTTVSTTAFDGSTWIDTYTSSGGTSTQSGTGSYTYSFTKDGKYTMKRTVSSTAGSSTYTTTWEEEGKWDFLTGVGELKNKEYIGLTLTKQTVISGASTGVTSYEGQSYSAWQITTLKNKEMILHLVEEDSNSSSGGASSSGNTTIDITLTQ